MHTFVNGVNVSRQLLRAQDPLQLPLRSLPPLLPRALAQRIGLHLLCCQVGVVEEVLPGELGRGLMIGRAVIIALRSCLVPVFPAR